jgi:hypothetical protein
MDLPGRKAKRSEASGIPGWILRFAQDDRKYADSKRL